jgi:hypothetical protein
LSLALSFELEDRRTGHGQSNTGAPPGDGEASINSYS